jgi:NAD(P)-dependent dehydrogenase (short-subunit alcohol dehydrogenase family)
MTDRVAIITGGTGSLGTALATRLAEQGFRLGVTYLVPDEAVAFEAGLDLADDRVLLKRVDAAQSDSIQGFVGEVKAQFGRLDAVACLVGGWAGGRDVVDTDDVRLNHMLDLNLRSAFNTLRAVIPEMSGPPTDGGRILLVGSRAAIDGAPGQAAFNVAKAGVSALARTVAQEVEDLGISINTIVPSVIDTPATRAALPYAEYMQWPTPDEIAAVAEFLLAGESGVISGAEVPVYGRT